jgi:hypothetical protein
MRSLWKIGCAIGCAGLLSAGGASAFELTGQDWTYQTSPMGEDWRVCTSGMPAGGTDRTKDGAAVWNYSQFTFTFGADFTGCTAYPSNDGTNQVDFGGGLGANVLAQTTWFFTVATGDIAECDMRFNNAFSWYTGTATPPNNQFDWWSVAAHEMGHCLGLNHEDDLTPTPIMGSTFAPGEVRRTPTDDDIAGRNAIYGAGCGILSFASNVPSSVAALPAAVWFALPLLFVTAWRLTLQGKRRTA